MFYTGVGLVCVLLMSVFIWLGKQQKVKRAESQLVSQHFIDEAYQPGVLTRLETDLRCEMQDGSEVGLLDLKGKVVVFAQFYANCPDCMSANMQPLREIQEKYKDNEDVHIAIITISSDDSADVVKTFCENIGVDKQKWWVLRAQIGELVTYNREQLKYADFKKNEGLDASARPYLHDMRISVFDRNLEMRNMVDLFSVDREKFPEIYDASRTSIDRAIDWCLENTGDEATAGETNEVGAELELSDSSVSQLSK